MSYHNRPQSTRSDDVTENGADPHIGLGGLHVAQKAVRWLLTGHYVNRSHSRPRPPWGAIDGLM